jgi:Arc/MetJ-type ribon-helix-helix transcriptional regulator
MKNLDRSEEKRKRAELIRLLKEGEDSGMIEDFDPNKFLAALHEKYKKG